MAKRNLIASHLVKFTLVTRGEAVSDDRTTAVVDVTFGCRVALVTFPTTDVTFTIEELDGDTKELDGRLKELDSTTLEFSDEGTKELVVVKDVSVLLIVGKTELTNDVDVSIGEVLFNTVVLSS